MKKAFITLLSVLFLSMPTYGWEMYVSNESANSITVYNQSGHLTDTISLSDQPHQLTFRENGYLYVACFYPAKALAKIDQNHNILSYINTQERPRGLTIGGNKHLYVGTTVIEEYDENDNFIKFSGSNGSVELTVGPNGNIYGADNGNHRVLEYDLNANIVNQFSTGANSWPRGIAFGPDGYLYVSRDLYNDIAVYNPNTCVMKRTIVGVTNPYGITFDPENHHLFVANFGANNILEYLYTEEFLGVFATGLSHPNHIAFKSSGTSTTTSINTSTTTIVAHAPESFEVTFNWTDSFQIYGWEPIPQVDGFDYYFSPEKIDSSFAGHKIKINHIEVSAPGTSLGNVINFNVEAHLNVSDITLPEGQFIQTHIDPVAGYISNAQTQFNSVIGGPGGQNSYTFTTAYDYTLGSGIAYPTLNNIITATNPEMNISDGLHAQLFFWTGDNRNCKIQFSGATLKVKGVILDMPPTTTTINPASCLVAYYPFDGNANDESGNGRTGTVYGATLTSDRFGTPNSAYDFNGVDNYIETPNNLNNYQAVSASFWLYMRTYPDVARYQVVSNDGGTWGRIININNDTQIELYHSSWFVPNNVPVLLSLNQWYLITALWTKDYSRLYVNTDLKIEGPGSIDGLDDLQSYFVGKPTYTGGGPSDYFDGVIDDLRIYNCPLTEAEIQQLYNQTPTLINLASFTAAPKAGRIVFAWSTESEIDNAGFNLYRSESENGNYIKINTSLIPAKGSPTQGASYEFIDTDVKNRKTYYYKLEDIDLNGTSTMHGPVSATSRWIYGMGKK